MKTWLMLALPLMATVLFVAVPEIAAYPPWTWPVTVPPLMVTVLFVAVPE
ncbi:MAG: hypothetical protein LBD68_03245 [Zoogloeaceae bacterium]|nr:hypothetical protein [Zoogloeaceae bacterium]